ncbi:hypothetical protein Fleli_1279 [Bernardetia litoralis DSM 6794]|uniref:BioF2-like acetyltransferase domain-containing protein n=1 Tax=Bernardetia litoralis (strain ATCC 23117 / DSM 6794 / NBRC 15988 / NCIMB 1366 / Fx l1 / Sio-4) TaxID=880071 RepID=I4AIC8_BERLS|nr:hypothetical protein [Bernardetia litoralis]AFM03713.1 hypothetical protein Fleli_1279 [Bernardetia litoralis DSM 6794]
MKHFKHHQIDKKKWDKCISSSKENIIYAFSWYLDCVSPYWEGFILESNNEYLAVMPLPVKKKYGIVFLQVPLFTQQLGIFSIKKLSSLEFKTFLILLQKKIKLVSNYPFNTINYQDFSTEFEEVFCEKEKEILKKHKTHHLFLQQNYATIRQSYKKDTKYRINQAQKKSFESIQKTEIDDIDLLWQFFEKSVFLENGISKQAKPTLKNLFKILKEKNLVELYYIQNLDKEILSGVLFAKSEAFYNNNSITKWIYLFNAANPNNRRDESRRWFLDTFIQEKSNQEYTNIIINNFENQSKNSAYETILDFESAQEKEVARFYASFGSEEKLFFVVDYNSLSNFFKRIQKIIQFIKNKIL